MTTDTATMRFARQTDLLNPDVCNKPVHIIGCGATGSFLALSLAKMGLTNLTVYDKDTIEEHNFPNQLFPTRLLGMNKAEALKMLVRDFTDIEINAIPHMYDGTQELEGIVVSALDSMKGRKLIYKNIKNNPKVELLIDPRTGPELFRILTVDIRNEFDLESYERTLVPESAVDVAPCTARAIIYSVLAVSAFLANQIKKYLMNQTDESFSKEVIIDMRHNISML